MKDIFFSVGIFFAGYSALQEFFPSKSVYRTLFSEITHNPPHKSNGWPLNTVLRPGR